MPKFDAETILEDIFDENCPKLILIPNTEERILTDIPNLFIETIQYYPPEDETITFSNPLIEFSAPPGADFISSLWILDINTVGVYQNTIYYQGKIISRDGLAPVEYAQIVNDVSFLVKKLNLNSLLLL